MKLYYSPGSCALAVHIVLRETDRLFELERVDLETKRTEKGADFWQINPKGYVPVLELTGGQRLTEANAVLQYLADLEPETKLAPPYGTFARYRLEEWLTFLSAELHKSFSWLFREIPEPWASQVRGRIEDRLHYAGATLGERDFLMGETFTIADAYFYPMLLWCDRFGIDLCAHRSLAEYRDRIGMRRAVVAAVLSEGLHPRLLRRSA